MARFEDLDVWRRAARLSAEIYKGLADLRDFGFRDQITRSGLSVPSNIAEGHERGSNKETAQFFSYAKGSAGELRTQIYIGMASAISIERRARHGCKRRKKFPECCMPSSD